MEADFIDAVVKLRVVIGYLGEHDQFGWWHSSFFARGSSAFLSPLFGRTQLLAQCNGVTEAAALVHDGRIGLGRVFHLFRLPEDIEQKIHHKLLDIDLKNLVDSRDHALSYLNKFSTRPDQAGVGPLRVGDKKLISDLETWKKVSGLYLAAFEQNIEIYPYLTEIS